MFNNVLKFTVVFMLIKNVESYCRAVDCEMTEWSRWRKCDRSCGGGLRMRIWLVFVEPKCGGRPCPLLNVKRERCNTQCCPIDCRYGP